MMRVRINGESLAILAALLCALGVAIVQHLPCEHTAHVLTEASR